MANHEPSVSIYYTFTCSILKCGLHTLSIARYTIYIFEHTDGHARARFYSIFVLFTLQNVHFSKSAKTTANNNNSNNHSYNKGKKRNRAKVHSFSQIQADCTAGALCSLRDYFAHRMELDLLLIKEYLALFVHSSADRSCFLDKKSVVCFLFFFVYFVHILRPFYCYSAGR